jgi:carboxypeptidase Taq
MTKYRDLSIFDSALSIFLWDTRTKVPPGAIGLRGQQMGLFSHLETKMANDPEIHSLLEDVVREKVYRSLNEVQRRNIYLFKKRYCRDIPFPEILDSEIEKQKLISYNAWKKAIVKKDFGVLKPELKKLFALKKQIAELIMKNKGAKTSYDAIIDHYEPKITEGLIAVNFEKLRKGIVPLMEKCASSKFKANRSFLKRSIPVSIQKEFSKSIADIVGFDISSQLAKGRIDETDLSFTTGYYDDVRIGLRYSEDNFPTPIFEMLHECGHAIYMQNLNREWMCQPLADACSEGFHESQARLLENVVGRSREFWVYFLPVLKRLAGSTLSDVGVEEMYSAVNTVEPSKIRAEADEVTYSMHIIIRFELERDLFSGKLSVEELPQAWNQKYSDYLGVEVKDDAEGVLQDVHWAQGYFGYFPSYALGNIYGGQLLNKMMHDMPSWRKYIEMGSFEEIREWLTKNVYCYGNLYNPLDLLKKITGEGINPSHFIDYLYEKYSEVYGF